MEAAARTGAGLADDALLSGPRQVLGDRLVTSEAVRCRHGRGEGLAVAALPDAVAFPTTNEEVAALARACHGARVPIVPFGTGTSLEGHVAAVEGGLCIDLGRMNRVLAVSPEALARQAQRGIAGDWAAFPSRPRCRRLPRRDGGDPGLRDDSRPVRHHAGERARADGRDAGRPGHPDGGGGRANRPRGSI